MKDVRHRQQYDRLRLAYSAEYQRLFFGVNPTLRVGGISHYCRRGFGLVLAFVLGVIPAVAWCLAQFSGQYQGPVHHCLYGFVIRHGSDVQIHRKR
ncbi:MAG TPA: hypothetical protein VJX16_25845 [Terriglobales bacterium]|nr:hypothetical protein [Terriglobales bacterium]